MQLLNTVISTAAHTAELKCIFSLSLFQIDESFLVLLKLLSGKEEVTSVLKINSIVYGISAI